MTAHYHVAHKHGAQLHFDERVQSWEASENGVNVTTDKGVYAADKLVIAAGPWASQVLTDLGLPLSVRRIVNVHFRPQVREPFTRENFPVYLMQVPEGDYYGFPIFLGRGLKIGRHDIGEPTTPDTIRREVDADEIEMLRAVLDRYMPGASGEVQETVTCMYTDTPDLHFVIDLHPEHSNVAIACGFSGHGYKFASAIGEVLADLAIDGSSRHDIGFLSAGRFAP